MLTIISCDRYYCIHRRGALSPHLSEIMPHLIRNWTWISCNYIRSNDCQAPPTQYLFLPEPLYHYHSQSLGHWVSYPGEGELGEYISFQVMTRCRVSPNRSLCSPAARWPQSTYRPQIPKDSLGFLHFRMRFLLRRRARLHKSIDLSAACRRFHSHWMVSPKGGEGAHSQGRGLKRGSLGWRMNLWHSVT